MISKKIKPVYVMNQDGLPDSEKQAVLDGASELIKLAGADIKLIDFGVWRTPQYKSSDDTFNEYQSVDWYIQKGRETSRNKTQLNADVMGNCLLSEPWRWPDRGGKVHYDILIANSDIYSKGTSFIIGTAGKSIGTIISTYRLKELDKKSRYECVKTETMHELGHVFGLIPDNRTENVEDSLGKHCTNRCIMRQGLSVPDDWIKMTDDRLRYGALCQACERDMKDYLRE